VDAKIDNLGRVMLYRKNRWKVVMCPYSFNDKSCGDWCVHFTETIREVDFGSRSHGISTCKKDFNVLEDLR
jgi:hypothetical protein